MEYRQIGRLGRCSMCYDDVTKYEDKVFANNSYKHKKLVIVCRKCMNEIYNTIKEEEENNIGRIGCNSKSCAETTC
jgi:hypothetical protein